MADLPGGPYKRRPFHGDKIPLNSSGYYITVDEKFENWVYVIRVRMVCGPG